MKPIILFFLFLSLLSGFLWKDNYNIYRKNIQINQLEVNNQENLENCFQHQVLTFNVAIKACQVPDMFNTVECIAQKILTSISQKWNVYAKDVTAAAGVSYWTFRDCALTVQYTGQFNRVYIGWPYQEYKETQNLIEEVQDDCIAQRKAALDQAMATCEIQDPTFSADCIKTQLQSLLNQHWNVYLFNQGAQASLQYWWINDCHYAVQNYGKYNRSFIIWRTN